MRKAGGIIAIVASSLGLIGALIGLFVGGVAGELGGLVQDAAENVETAAEQAGEEMDEAAQDLDEALAQIEEVVGDQEIDEFLDESGALMQRQAWFGIAFSIVVIVLGAITIPAKNWMPGAGLIVVSVLGFFFAGGFVSFMMIVTGLGGILALFPIKPEAEES